MNLQCTTAAFTVFPEPKDFVTLCPLVPETRPSMRFLFVGSHLCARASSTQPLAGLHLPSASGYHGWAYGSRSHAGSPTGDFHPISSCPCRAYTTSQIEQLAWVINNPLSTPELETRKVVENIHPEIPRALARVYCLQLLRSGSERDYQRFISPQINADVNALEQDSFNTLSTFIRQFDNTAYEVLEAAAIISAVTLSPEAINRSQKVLKEPIPTDSVQFLAVTAPYAGDIYPLAGELISRNPDAKKLFEAAFMPDSHLRHMMYNEGSLSMYRHIKKGIANGSINQGILDLWYAHWLANIAGFRGHIAPKGSLYLDQNTYRAVIQFRDIFKKMLAGESINPMLAYLKSRARWLGLDKLTKDRTDLTALGSLGASLRLFTPKQGQALFNGFQHLTTSVRQRWRIHTEEQLKELPYPSETYGPALFANTREIVGLEESIKIVIPVYISVLEAEKHMRRSGMLTDNIPVSFRELARKDSIDKILQSRLVSYPVVINPVTGIANIKIN